jgi:hypothetical protein
LKERDLRRLVALSILLISGLTPLGAIEVNKEGYLFPNPARADKKAIRPKDYTDRIPGPETLVKIYKKNDEMVFDTFEIEGEIYSCQFHIKGKEGEPTTVYLIADRDGDGIFETKYFAGEVPTVPDWVIERYYKKHPEGKDPGPAADAHRLK